jgi:hypothetical protein
MQWSLNKLIACNLNKNDIYYVLLTAYHFCDDILCLVLQASSQQWSDSNLTKVGILLS